MQFDAIIIGAGVGGSCAALALANRGFSVALIDAGAVGRPKVCGEFLSPEIRGTFARLGVLDAILAAGALETGAARVLTSRRTGRAFPFAAPGLAISRGLLDSVLWRETAARGALTLQKTRVKSVKRCGELWQVSTSGGEFCARFLLDASGRNGHFKSDEKPQLAPSKKTAGARFIGLKTHLRGANVAKGEVMMFPLRGGYCGLVGIENGLTNACALLNYSEVNGQAPPQIWDDFRAQNSALARATENATPQFEWLATANVRFGRFFPSQNEILCVGDAAGYIHPLTGDGMAMAARSGELAALAIASSALSDVTQTYQTLWKDEFSRRLRFAAFLQPLFTIPALTAPALALCDVFPALAARSISQTRGALNA